MCMHVRGCRSRYSTRISPVQEGRQERSSLQRMWNSADINSICPYSRIANRVTLPPRRVGKRRPRLPAGRVLQRRGREGGAACRLRSAIPRHAASVYAGIAHARRALAPQLPRARQHMLRSPSFCPPLKTLHASPAARPPNRPVPPCPRVPFQPAAWFPSTAPAPANAAHPERHTFTRRPRYAGKCRQRRRDVTRCQNAGVIS